MFTGKYFDPSLDPYFSSRLHPANAAADFHLLTTKFSPYTQRMPHVTKRKVELTFRYLSLETEEPTSVSLQLNNMWRKKYRAITLPDQVSKVRKLELDVLLSQSQDLAVINLTLNQGMLYRPPPPPAAAEETIATDPLLLR